MNKKKKKKNFCLSYRETRPTRSIDVDLTFIVDEQRSSIKNVLETNNNSSSGSGIRKGTERTRIYVCDQSDRLDIDPRYTHSLFRHLEKILIVHDFFLFLVYVKLAFVRFHDFFLFTDPLILLLISTRDREK